MVPARAFTSDNWNQSWPFLAVSAFAYLIILLTPDKDPSLLIYAAALLLLLITTAVWVPWRRFNRRWELTVPLAYVGFVILLSYASGEHFLAAPGPAVLFTLPLMWTAMWGDRFDMAVVLAAIVAASLAFVISMTGPSSLAEAGLGALEPVVITLVGFIVQDLVGQVRQAALRDPLTGLANRNLLDDVLRRQLARSRREGSPLSVLMLDLDHFKAYNDAHGHQRGDEYLRTVTSSWHQELRESDLLARWGGEEFLCVLPDCDVHTACKIGERLRLVMPSGQSVSGGIAELGNGETAEALIHRADKALYQAKEEGRDRISIG